MKQSVKVNVHVGDTVQLLKGRAPQQQMAMGDFRLLKGVGATYANEPVVLKQNTYGVYPASVAPMYDSVIKTGGGSEYNMNKRDDLMIPTNPSGITPKSAPSKRIIPGKDMWANRRVNYSFVQETPFQGENPAGQQVPVFQQSTRAVPTFLAERRRPRPTPSLFTDTPDIARQLNEIYSTSEPDLPVLDSVGSRVVGAGPGRRPEKTMLTYGPSVYAGKKVAHTQQTIPVSERKMARGGSVF
jgi:hypothetical protein